MCNYIFSSSSCFSKQDTPSACGGVIHFRIKPDEREWKKEWLKQLQQLNMFESANSSVQREIIRKLPYKFYYHFLTEDNKLRKLMIEDWEIGALFWHCLSQTEGDEEAAKQLVRQKYFDQFVQENDLYLFLGTTFLNHNIAPNPFVIIGVFYPPKTDQLSLL